MPDNRRPRYMVIAVIAVITVLMAALIIWFKPAQSSTQAQRSISSAASSDSVIPNQDHSAPDQIATTGQARALFVTGLEQLPRSLQGTEVDGEIIIDEQQRLVVTEGLRRLFDYFLSALGEEDEATITARIGRYIHHRTPEPAASQAMALFNQYVKYLKALSQIDQRYGNLQLRATKNGQIDLNLMTQSQQDIKALRQQYFDVATVTAFFGVEDDYNDYSMAMLDIEQNSGLSAAQKSVAKEAYISRMPNSPIKETLTEQTNLATLFERTAQMKAVGASPEALYNMRSELVGEAAATRLAAIDTEDADFDQRFVQYQAQKQQLISDSGDNTQTRAQIDQLEKQLFSDTERKRLVGYGAMQNSQAK